MPRPSPALFLPAELARVARKLFDHPCKFEVCPHLTDDERETLGSWLEEHGISRALVPPRSPGRGYRTDSANRRADRRWWRIHEDVQREAAA